MAKHPVDFPTPRDQPTDLESYALSGTFPVGSYQVHHVTDGVGFGVRRFWFNGIEPSEWMPVLGLDDPDTPFPINFGLFVVAGHGRVILVDSGFGPASLDIPGLRGANELLQRLAELGIGRDDVDTVVQTHLHSDHCGQLVLEQPGGGVELTFPNATVHLHQSELDHWMGEAGDKDPMSPYVRSRMAPVQEAGLIRTFTEPTELAPCVTAVPMVGHTPGHTVVRVSSGGAECLLVGDLIHHPVHVRHRDWLPAIDFAPPQSIQSRSNLVDLAIELDAMVTAPHLPILTLGRLHRSADGVVHWRPVELGRVNPPVA